MQSLHSILLLTCFLVACLLLVLKLNNNILDRKNSIGNLEIKKLALRKLVSPELVSPTGKSVRRRIPTVLLGGAQKAGTTSVAAYLNNNLENICESTHGKEAHFFDVWYKEGLNGYQDLFLHCKNPDDILFDATPEIMLLPERVNSIYSQDRTKRELKIIFILREPVSREISFYNMCLKALELPDPPQFAKAALIDENGKVMPFSSFVDISIKNTKAGKYTWERGYYAHWLREWVKYFYREQILILSFDELATNPTSFLDRVHAFLNLPRSENSNLPLFTHKNSTASPPCKEQLLLAEKYDQPNKELYNFFIDYPGPEMEQIPFPKFHVKCREEQQ